jgi:pimeloyl-ACP methyl ester carboxylesterase
MNLTPQEALAGVEQMIVQTPKGPIQYRQSGRADQVTHVLLHGIGSASANWAYQLGSAVGVKDLRVVAWDAPGYGQSAHLEMPEPSAANYATMVWLWLDALGVSSPVQLVGHSLGALMAASAVLQQPDRVSRSVFLAPAKGYGDAEPAERKKVVEGRLSNLEKLGPAGMANARASAMLSSHAKPWMIDAVRQTMSEVDPRGYTQAVKMLGQGNLIRDVYGIKCSMLIASGEADTITPPSACDQVAHAAQQKRLSLGEVGHACPLEAALAINHLLGLPSQIGHH